MMRYCCQIFLEEALANSQGILQAAGILTSLYLERQGVGMLVRLL